jgi:hypothetical protein
MVSQKKGEKAPSNQEYQRSRSMLYAYGITLFFWERVFEYDKVFDYDSHRN